MFENPEIPGTNATHAIFLGGPMSVNDEQEYPYLQQEKAFIRHMIKDKKQVLGICLGAQAHRFGFRSEGVSICARDRVAADLA